MVAPVVGALAWRFIFADGYGMINSLAASRRRAARSGSPTSGWRGSRIVIANLWMALPFDILVLLAGLASLPPSRSRRRRSTAPRLRRCLSLVVLPLLKPVIAVILVVRLADAFRIFDVVYVLTGGGPAKRPTCSRPSSTGRCSRVFDFPGGAAAAVLLVLRHGLSLICCGRAAARCIRTPVVTRRGSSFAGVWLFLLVVCAPFPVPIFWIVSTSLKPTPRSSVTPRAVTPGARRSITMASHCRAISDDTCVNSLVAAGGATTLGFVLAVPAAWGFAKFPLSPARAALLPSRRHAGLPADRAGAAVLPAVCGHRASSIRRSTSSSVTCRSSCR